MKLLAKILLLPTVSLLFGATASSYADEALFSRPSQALGQLWSGVLGCHDPAGASFAPRDRYTTDDITSDLDEPARRDYAECAKQTLRSESSRMLVQTIEDAFRYGGILLFDEHFRLDSSVSWVWGESVRGNIDAVIPFWNREHGDGTGSALFMQHGLSLWNGLGSTERIDGNLGLVFRSHLAADTIAGGSLFYDYNFEREHARLGAGVDVQSGIFRAAANYYYPLGGWRGGRGDYVEQALRGADLRLGLALDRLRLDGTAGVWRFEGEDGVRARQRASYGLEGGYRVLPGVFLEGGYEHHDSEDSLGSRWNAGLAFRFSLPDFQGATGEGGRLATPNLWEVVDRERRIVYEERLGIVPSVASVASFTTMEEGDGTLAMTFAFDRPLEREVTVVIEPTTGSTMNPARYTISGEAFVAPPVQGDEGVSTASAQTGGTPGRLEMALPQHTISLTLTLDIAATNDNIAEVDDAEEADKFIELAASTTGENSEYARFDGVMRVAVPRYDSYTIGFAATSSVVSEDVGTAHLLLRLGHPAPGGGIPISVSASGATDGIAFASPASIAIPAETAQGQIAQSVASVAVPVTDDEIAEDDEIVTFTISEGEGFPTSPWQIDPSATTYTLTILASDQPKGDVSFAAGNSDSASRGESISLTVMSSALANADLPLTWTVDPADEVETATGSVTIASGSDSQSFTINISEGGDAVSADRITVALAAPDLPVGWSLGDNATHVIAIADNAAPPPTPFTRRINRPRILNFATAEDSVDEGASVSTTLSVSPAPDGEVAIPVTIPSNTGAHTIAVAPAEALSNGVISFSADRPSINLTLNALEDDSDTVDESVTVSLGNPLPLGYSVGGNSDWVVYIADNDEPASIGGTIGFRSDTDVTATEGGSATIQLAFSQALPLDAQIGVAVSGVANASEYTLAWLAPSEGSFQDGVARVPMGSASFTLSMTVPEDDNTENETVTVTLAPTSLPEGWSISTPSTSRILITDTTPVARNTIGLVPTSTPVEEGADIALNAVLKDPNGVPLSTSGGDAIAIDISIVAGGSETSFAGSSIVIPANSTLANGVHRIENFSIDDDLTTELEKTLTLSMSEGAGFPSSSWEIDSSADGIDFVIAPSDNTIVFAAPSSASIGENGGSASITVGINLPIPADITPTIAITPGGDARPADYELSVSGGGSISGNTWTLPTGQGSATLVVSAVDNEVIADDKILTLGFAEDNLPNGWRVPGATSYDITIANDDEPTSETVGFAPLSATFNRDTVREGETARMRVVATPVAPVDIQLTWTITEGGDKVDGADTGSVTIAQGSASADFDLVITDDSEANPAETVAITLVAGGAGLPEEWVLVTAMHTITIPTNGNVFAFSAPADDSINEGGSTNLAINFDNDLVSQSMLRLDVSGDGISSGDITITADKGAIFDEDSDDTGSGTLTIPGGATSPITLTVVAENDSMPELGETLVLALSGTHAATQLPEGWSIGASGNSQNITINAGGNTVRLATTDPATDTTLEEGGAVGQFRILIDNPFLSEQSLTLTATEGDGGEDDFLITLISPSSSSYDRATGALTIMPGQADSLTPGSVAELVFGVQAVPDDITELEETLALTLAVDSGSPLPSGWRIDDGNDELAFTIPSNDNTIGFQADTSITQIESGMHSVGIDVHFATPSEIVVGISTGGTATVGTDYAIEEVIRIPANVTEATAVVQIISDTHADPGETVELIISETTLPAGWSIDPDRDTHTITITDDEQTGGVVRITSTPLSTTLVESNSIIIDVAATNTDNFIATISEDVVLNVAISASGDTDIPTPAYRNDPISLNDHSIGDLVIDSDTGMGSFTFVAEDDDIAEGLEFVTLTLMDPDGNLPDGWRIAETMNRFIITIPANDNAARFSEWTRGDPGSVAGVSAIIEEGGMTAFNVLVDHIAPAGNLPLHISVPAEYSDDISFLNVDSRKSSWNAETGIFTFKRNVDIEQMPNIAAVAQIIVASDGIPEPTESFDITLMQGAGWPDGWGSVASAPDIGTPAVATSTTFAVTIPANDNSATFTVDNSNSVDERDGSIALNIVLTNDAPAGGLPLTITASGDTSAISFDETLPNVSTHDFSIAEGTSNGHVTVYIQSDDDSDPENVTFMLAARSGFPGGWGDVPIGETHTLNITDPKDIGFEDAETYLQHEGGSHPIAIYVNPPAPSDIALNITTAGTATRGTDYAIDWRVTVLAGEEYGYATLVVTPDADVEPDETVDITISGTLPNGWKFAQTTHTVHIQNDDGGEIGFASAHLTVEETASNGTVNIPISVPAHPARPISVEVAPNTGSSTALYGLVRDYYNPDRVVSITQSGNINFPLLINSDDIPEIDETIVLTLIENSSDRLPQGWSIDPDNDRFTITISANDNTIAFVDAAVTLLENAGTHNVRISVNLPNPSENIVLNITTSGSATSGSDYTAVSTPVTIPAGRSSIEVPVTIIDDDIDDGGNETITLAIGGTLPSGWSLGRATYTITIIDDEPGGVVGITSTPLSTTLVEPSTVTIDVAVTNRESFIVETSEDVVLDIAMTAVGDTRIPAPAWRNNPTSPNDYTIGSLVIDKDTGRGSFTFTVEDDDIAEGLEVVTLALTDPNGNLPGEWRISEIMNRLTFTIPANDNAARFSEWPRSDPGSFAGLSATVVEGGNNERQFLNILVDHIAPVSGLPMHLSVPDEHFRDIYFENYSIRRAWSPLFSNNVVFRHNVSINHVPNLAAGFQIVAIDDDIPEPDETFDVTLTEFPSFPNNWGSVSNGPDIGTPAVATSTTLSVTVPASDNSATFAIDNPGSVAKSENSITLGFVLTNDAPVGGLPLRLIASGDTEAISFDESQPGVITHDFSVAAGTSSGQVTVYIQSDDNNDLDRVAFTLAAGSNFPVRWGGVPADEIYTLNITEPNVIGGNLAFALPESQAIEPDFRSAVHTIYINAVGAIPAGGFPLAIAVDDTSTASDSDYSVVSALLDGSVINTTVASGAQALDFSIPADDIPEIGETIELVISADQPLPEGWRVASLAKHTITIAANDNTVGFKYRYSSIASENISHSAALVVNLAAPSEIVLAVTTSGSAIDGSDYITDSEIRIPANTTESVATIHILPDTEHDPNETVILTISEVSMPTGWSTARYQNSHIAFIEPEDNVVDLRGLNDYIKQESGTHSLLIAIYKPLPSDVVLDITTTGTATRGTDYTVDSQFTIPANEAYIYLPFVIVPDTDSEPNETIRFNISGTLPNGWNFGNTTKTITIPNDDEGMISFTSPHSVFEEKATTEIHRVGINLTTMVLPASDIIYTINAASTATEGLDYTATGGIPFWDQEDQIMNLSIVADSVPEVDETIILEFDESNLPPNVRLGDIATHTVTIPANDNSIKFASYSSTVNKFGTHDVEVVIDAAYPQDITLNIETAGTAREGIDNGYTVSPQVVIPANQKSVSIPVTISQNAVDEVIETIELSISAAETLPTSWHIISPSTHTITITDAFAPIEIVGGQTATLNEPSTSVDSSVTINVSAFDTAGFIAATTEDVSLAVTMASGGDPDIASSQLRNVASSPNDYAVGTLIIDSDTGTGSFTFDVLEDALPEGREIITLTIEDPEGNLPDGWAVSDTSHQFTVNVGANDNAARFSEWTRGDPGSIAEISATIKEGEMLPFNILIDHVAPVGGLPLHISIPDEYVDDISLHNVDSGRSSWDADTGIFTFQRSGNIGHAHNIAATAQIRAVNDGIMEPMESFDITLMQGAGWPGDWGSVRDAPDIVAPALMTATTFNITIPGDSIATFAVDSPDSAFEGDGSVTLDIALTHNAPEGDLPLTLVASGDANAISFDETRPNVITHNFSIAAGTSSEQVTVYIQPDDDNYPESVTFTLTAGPDFPEIWGSVPAGETRMIDIADPKIVGFEDAETHVQHETGVHSIAVYAVPPAPSDIILDITMTGTATRGTDYAIDSRVTVAAGERYGYAMLVVTPDTDIEIDETVELTLSGTLPNGWVLAQTTHTVYIYNDDEGKIGFVSAGLTVEETALNSAVNVSVSTSAYLASPISTGVVVNAYSATASHGIDYYLSGSDVFIVQSSNTDFDVIIGADDVPELAETIVLTLVENASDPLPLGWRIDTDNDEFTITISANDNIVAFTNASVTLIENAGTHNVRVSVNRPHPSEDINLNIITGGSATSGSDYVAVSTPVTIPAGQDSVDIPFTIIDDDIEESGSEIITLTIGGTLPDGWSLGRATHIITVIDDEPDGVVEIMGSHLSATLSEPDTITIDVAATNKEGFIAATSEDVVLSVAMIAAGDRSIPVASWRNNPRSPNDYTVGNLVIDSDTGQGNFTFTVEDDNIAEGLETVVLALTDPDENLPGEWRIAGIRNQFIVTIPANDNAARFSEWPRNDPGSFAGLSATVVEGEENEPPRLNILIDHIAPAFPSSDLPMHISVLDEHVNDIYFKNFDQERIVWKESNNDLLFLRKVDINEVPNFAAGLQIFATDDGIPEPDETFDITLTERLDFPSDWGSVANGVDIRTPRVATSTTFSVTIPASDNSAVFAVDNPASAVEGDSSIALNITLTNGAPAGGIPLTLTASGDTGAVSFHETLSNVHTHNFSIAEGTSSGHVTVYIQSDDNNDLDRVTFALTAGLDFPNGWGGVPVGETHVLNITEPNAVGGALAFALTESQAVEPASGRTAHIVHINAAGTLPEGGLPIAVAIDSASTASGSDYSVMPTLSVDSVINTTVTEGVLALEFSVLSDNTPETDETIELAISASQSLPDEWRIASPSTHIITIPANGNIIGFEMDASTAGSEQGTHSAALKIDLAAPSEIVLALVAAGTATNGVDYTADSEIRIPANTTEADATIQILPDTDDDPGETIRLTISEVSLPTGWSIGSGRDTHTIAIDPRDNTIGFGESVTHLAREDGTHFLNIDVDKPALSDIVLDVVTAGTATRGADYYVDSQFTISANTTSARLPFVIIPDTASELSETIKFSISGTLPDGWNFARTIETVTIPNDDQGTISFVSSGSVFEETAATNQYLVHINLTAIPWQATDIRYTIGAASTATTDVDYAASGIIPFQNIETRRVVPVSILADTIPEFDETIILELDGSSLPQNLTLGDITTHTVTIPANDNVVKFTSFRSTTNETGVHDVEVAIDGAYPQDITLSIETAGTAQEGSDSDYTVAPRVIIPANQRSVNIPVVINSDTVDEIIETIELTIKAMETLPTGWRIVSPRTHTITIVD